MRICMTAMCMRIGRHEMKVLQFQRTYFDVQSGEWKTTESQEEYEAAIASIAQAEQAARDSGALVPASDLIHSQHAQYQTLMANDAGALALWEVMSLRSELGMTLENRPAYQRPSGRIKTS